MGTVNTNYIVVGMELAADVTNPQGMTLLKAGSVINEKQLLALKAWGVTEADVQGIEQHDLNREELSTADEEKIKRVDLELRIFRRCDLQEETISEIYRLVRKRFLSRRAHG